jgi:hypothetical protein
MIIYASVGCYRGKAGENETEHLTVNCAFSFQLQQSDLGMKARAELCEMQGKLGDWCKPGLYKSN